MDGIKESSITTLDLSCNGLGPSAVATLARATWRTALTTLSLEGNSIGGRGKWRGGALFDSEDEQEGFAAIANALYECTTLTSLDIARTGLGPRGTLPIAAALHEKPAVVTLNLANN